MSRVSDPARSTRCSFPHRRWPGLWGRVGAMAMPPFGIVGSAGSFESRWTVMRTWEREERSFSRVAEIWRAERACANKTLV